MWFLNEKRINNKNKLMMKSDLFIDIIFEDNNSDGNFVPVNPFIPIENVDYELNVFYNEDLYQSQSK